MLAVFLRELGASTFVEKLEVGEDVYAFRFERSEGEVTMMWCNGRTYEGPWPADYKRVINAHGEVITLAEVGEEPVYLVS